MATVPSQILRSGHSEGNLYPSLMTWMTGLGKRPPLGHSAPKTILKNGLVSYHNGLSSQGLLNFQDF